jgi:ATP-dependent helicase/nuclease subunit B
MHIIFSWDADGARWTGSTAPATLGRVVVGPARLAGILATRLACSSPAAARPARTAVVRRALDATLGSRPADTPYVASFRADPWTLSRHVLAWRDELVTAGWDGVCAADASPRMRLLADVSELLAADPGWLPGGADELHAVDELLSDLAGRGLSWPTGIDVLEVDHSIAALPPVWRRILGNLGALGVRVTELDPPGPVDRLRVVTTDTTWDAAVAAVRLLRDDPAGTLSTGPVTVLASRPTGLLDREAARRGLPASGVADDAGARAATQVVPLFLAAVTTPPDVQAIGTLLCHPIAGTDSDGRRSPVCLVRAADRRALLAALAAEPGIGGPAWADAVDGLPEDSPARGLDELLQQRPLEQSTDGGYRVGEVTDHLSWLADRLAALAHGPGGPVLAETAAAVATAANIIAGLGEDAPVSDRELRGVITDCTDGVGRPTGSGPEACGRIDVVTRPGQLGADGGAPVLWWIPVDDGAAPAQTFRPAEVRALAEAGVDLPDRPALASLHLDSQLRAVRRRGDVTAVLPATVDGEAAAVHPVLSFLVHDRGAASLPDSTGGLSTTAAALLPEAVHVPAATDPERPDPFHRTFRNGKDLVPDYLSYSQWTALLAHPLEWLLERRLGVSAGGLADIPTGNRMIGTFIHAVVEEMVRRRLGTGPDATAVAVVPEPGEIRAELDRQLPRLASELLLPGNSRRRGIVLEEADRAITELFAELGKAGARVSGAETKYRTVIAGSHGRDDQPIQLGGYRDLDIVLPDGRAGVIDLKYTRSKKKYRELVEEGAALQLAVYAYSVASDRPADLDGVPVGYFSLKQARMDTTSPGLGSPTLLETDPAEYGSSTMSGLWDRAVSGLDRILDDLRHGEVTDVGNLLEDPEWKALNKADKNDKDNKNADAAGSPRFSPADVAHYRAAVETAVHRDFLPLDITEYTSFALITGLDGDYK